MQCPLCKREGVHLEAHHLKTRRVDRFDTVDICVECHKTIHGLFTNPDLRDPTNNLDTLAGLRDNPRFRKALRHIKKLTPGSFMKMKRARSHR